MKSVILQLVEYKWPILKSQISGYVGRFCKVGQPIVTARNSPWQRDLCKPSPLLAPSKRNALVLSCAGSIGGNALLGEHRNHIRIFIKQYPTLFCYSHVSSYHLPTTIRYSSPLPISTSTVFLSSSILASTALPFTITCPFGTTL